MLPADKAFVTIVTSLIFTVFAYNAAELFLETPAEREMAECRVVCGVVGDVQSFTREPAGNTICLCQTTNSR
jgi:hypothetical protein